MTSNAGGHGVPLSVSLQFRYTGWPRMAHQELPQDFKEFLRWLNDHEVEYLLIGGYAVGYYGYPRTTDDMDVWIELDEENASKLDRVLADFGMSSNEVTREPFLKPGNIVRMGLPPVRCNAYCPISVKRSASAHFSASSSNADSVFCDRVSLLRCAVVVIHCLPATAAACFSLREVNNVNDRYDRLVRNWYSVKAELALRPDAPGTSQALRRFDRELEELSRSGIEDLTSELSTSLLVAFTSLVEQWRELEPLLREREGGDWTVFDQFESVLSDMARAFSYVVELHRRVIATLIAFLGIVIVAVIGMVAFLGGEAARERRDAVQARKLAQATIRGQERERARISRALHDSLAQELSVALLDVAAVVETRSEQAVAALKGRLSSAIRWVRDLSHEIHPAELSAMGLSLALSRYCEDLDTGDSINVQWDIPGELPDINTDAAINIYRIAQEAVTNAIRHAQASTVVLRVRFDQEGLSLTVADDGIGMRHDRNPHVPPGGIGVAGMQERARMLEAALSMGPGQSGGTVVRLTVPYESLR